MFHSDLEHRLSKFQPGHNLSKRLLEYAASSLLCHSYLSSFLSFPLYEKKMEGKDRTWG